MTTIEDQTQLYKRRADALSTALDHENKAREGGQNLEQVRYDTVVALNLLFSVLEWILAKEMETPELGYDD